MAVAVVPLSRAAPVAPAQPVAEAPSKELPEVAPVEKEHPLERADLESWLDGMVPYVLKSGDIAGAVVVVVKNGTVLLQKGYGYADVAKKVPMDPERTMIRLGSTSKLFTWTAVMQLVEQGKLDLDRNVNDYLDFKIPTDFGKPVTLRDLMNHRGGFEEGLKDILWTNPEGVPSTEAYLKDHPRPMLFPPGEVPAYSNYGAALAGYIVERVSKEPFEQYIQSHILNPLNMAHTSFAQPLQPQFMEQVSNGYRAASDPPGPFELIVTRPAGSGTATVADMSRFMLAHLQDGQVGDAQILKADTAKLMHTASQDMPNGFATMAHGFFREVHNGRTVIGHGGDSILFHNEFNLLPAEKVGIEFNFNSRGRNDSVYLGRAALFDGFMDRYFPETAKAADSPALPTAVTDAGAIAGRYESSRRVEHGFISIFYVLQQTVIVANPDGTILAPSFPETEPVPFKEVGPQIWQRMGGHQMLTLKTIGGVKTVIDSTDPSSVLQAVPLERSAALNLTVLLASFAVMTVTLMLWALSRWLKPARIASPDITPLVRRLKLAIRAAAAIDMLYLIAWFVMLRPLLSLSIDVYNSHLDPVVIALQLTGLVAIAGAVLGVWSAWRLARLNIALSSRVWNSIVALSLVGIVWIGFVGGLFRISVNY
jgi:CubicO group peptidase (beta-lactamase class C family)